MEIHRVLPSDIEKISIDLPYLEFFQRSLEFTKKYYCEDFSRILNTKFLEITPEFFFREYIWCVYTSGFNAKIVSKFFPKLEEIYKPLFDVFSGETRNLNTLEGLIAVQALKLCYNKRKVEAVFNTAFDHGQKIKEIGWPIYKEKNLSSPEKLQNLGYIGPSTRFHLARNIGLLNYIKPDLHLERATKHWGFKNSLQMCETIKENFDLPLGIIDLCLWYSLSTFGSKSKTSLGKL